MLKVKKLKLSGFRGILNPQELDLIEGYKDPRSLVLFGLNSSGKTSFVDGFEWFLSPTDEIDWLKREDAKERAYPHQAAKDKGVDSFVEVEFQDTENKIGKLTKTYDHKKPTIPVKSDDVGFKEVYSSSVIRPYFRYLEVVDFVVSPAGVKYKSLAKWMGFEDELIFQEKIALNILQELRGYEKELSGKVGTFEQQLKQLINGITATDMEVLNYCNGILTQHKVAAVQSVNEVWSKIPEINKQKNATSAGLTLEKLTKIENVLVIFVLNKDLPENAEKLEKKIAEFKKEKESARQIDVMGLYTQAIDIITGQTEVDIKCPVCGKEWEREKLINHIKGELELLKKVKEEKDTIDRDIASLKIALNSEALIIKGLLDRYEEVKDIIGDIKFDEAKSYKDSIDNFTTALSGKSTGTPLEISLSKESHNKIIAEKEKIAEQIKAQKAKIQPSEAETKLAEDIGKLNQVQSSWQSLVTAKSEQEFTANEINNFYTLKDEVVRILQNNVETRFKEISDRIGKYFGILRNDKDIKDIKIELNKEKGKAAGRSAEIQLTYYNISVKPAYKVLSESLLNSLGLAVYFTCVKQFNSNCRFIVLDDIMNSLDVDKRDTLLDLIEQEFSDYQIILFTHDYFWFQKIVRRFPNWIHKKIKGWDYIGGAKIDSIKTTKEEIDEYLKDSTKIDAAGWILGRHVESILNELCEDLHAELRYRYTKNDPPSMDELFDAIYKRLKSKVNGDAIVDKILEVKKYEPTLRNFVDHARSNQAASVSPQDVKRASDEWFLLESELWCDKCNRFVEYHKSKDSIECQCGNKKFEPVKTPAK